MVLRLHELGESFECLFTATGNELPEVIDHLHRVLVMVGNPPLHQPKAPSLADLIQEFKALPNWRQRWCTRMIKIEPCVAFLRANPGCTLLVGLRADEQERTGLYGEWAQYRYPLREWGWGIRDVKSYCQKRGVTIPTRTDCAVCYGQQIGEWYALWRDHRDFYLQGERWELETGYTFRSPSRDTWPAALRDLRREFESGRLPRSLSRLETCRVCSG